MSAVDLTPTTGIRAEQKRRNHEKVDFRGFRSYSIIDVKAEASGARINKEAPPGAMKERGGLDLGKRGPKEDNMYVWIRG